MPQIRLQARPGGPGCEHVLIRSEAGAVLRSVLIQQLFSRIDAKEDSLVVQIKRVVKDLGTQDLVALKTAIELKDFDF